MTPKANGRGWGVWIACILSGLILLSGCGKTVAQTGNNMNGVLIPEEAQAVAYAPMLQPDGDKLRIGLLDIDEYEPASIYLYYVLQGLKEKGWLTFETLPFTTASMDAKSMIAQLAQMDLGPYIEFVAEAAYYLAYEDEEQIARNMREQIQSDAGLDIILAMGTEPGLFMQKHAIPTGTLVCMSTDPVKAGIIQSSPESGNPNVWAQVEPLPYYRQLKFYHNILPFSNIGMIYTDSIVAGISDYEKGADELGIKLTHQQIENQRQQTPDEIADYTQILVDMYEKMISEYKIDAYMLNASLVGSNMDLSVLLAPFANADIPVFVQDGENYVREGALLLVASTDNRGVGQFVAQVIAQVACGVAPGEIPCEYVSSPYMSVNLDAAKAVGFRPSFEMLLSCETIYSSSSKREG